MVEKNPKKDDAKRKVEPQGFQEPPSMKSSQEPEHEYEEATTEQFEEPTTDHIEEAAAAETRAAVLGVDAQLLDIKHQIEEQLKAASTKTRALAEDTYTGMNNIVGVGIALGAADYGQGDGMTMGIEPGMPCLQLYVVESVPLAIYAARSIVRFPLDAVLRSAIEAGGDTDTIASMTGQIAGTWIGALQISRDMIQLLPDANDIEQIANAFAGVIDLAE